MAQDHAVAAGNRTPSPRQPDSDEEDEVVHHFWDEPHHEGEDPPQGGYPGRGGPPGRGPPDGGPPDDDDNNNNKPDDDDDDEDDEGPLPWQPPIRPTAGPSTRRQPAGPQPVGHPARRNYLRGFTPGNNRYMGSMQQQYVQHI